MLIEQFNHMFNRALGNVGQEPTFTALWDRVFSKSIGADSPSAAPGFFENSLATSMGLGGDAPAAPPAPAA